MKKKIAITLIAVLLCVFSAAALTACGGIQFEGRTLDGGKVGAAYSTDISVDDETVFYELDYDSELPRGLYLGEDGIIEGTPSEAGTFTFKIVAYNDSSETVADFSLTIDKGELSYTAKTLPDATAVKDTSNTSIPQREPKPLLMRSKRAAFFPQVFR